MVHILRRTRWTQKQDGIPMTLELHPRISRVRRQSAVEQTSDLLKAYLQHGPDPFESANDCDEHDEPDESDDRNTDLTAGFLIPDRRWT